MGALFDTVERMWQANEAGDADAYLSHVSEDAEWGMPGTTVRGKEAVREVQRTFRDAFPDFRHEVLDHVESGNKIALQLRVEGTHTGPLRTPGGEIPPTGKAVVWDAVDYVTFDAEGKVATWRAYFDQMSFLTQLGLLPAPSGA